MIGTRNLSRIWARAPRFEAFAFVLAGLAACGCHTWQGVKEDTRHAVQETGNEMEKAGKKLKGDDEKKPANPPAKADDAGAPKSDH